MGVFIYRKLLLQSDSYLEINHNYSSGWRDGILYAALHDPDIDSEDYASLNDFVEGKSNSQRTAK